MTTVVFWNIVKLSIFRKDTDIIGDDAGSFALVASYDLIDAAAQRDFLLDRLRMVATDGEDGVLIDG